MQNIFFGPQFDWFFVQKAGERYLSEKENDSVLVIKIALDPLYDHHHREVYTIQNWLIAISGISRAIMIMGLIASQYISNHIFKTEMIENLFMRSSQQAVTKNESPGKSRIILELKNACSLAEKAIWNEKFKKFHVLAMVNVICQLQKFKVTKQNIFALIGLGCLTKCLCKKQDRQDRLFKKAKIFLEKELDIIKLLQSVSQSKLLLKGMLSRSQQILINFQRRSVIETTVTGDTTDENIEEMFMNYMKSQNPMDRLFAVSKANRLLQEYVGNSFADPVDAKLVMGLYNRNTDLNDYMKR